MGGWCFFTHNTYFLPSKFLFISLYGLVMKITSILTCRLVPLKPPIYTNWCPPVPPVMFFYTAELLRYIRESENSSTDSTWFNCRYHKPRLINLMFFLHVTVTSRFENAMVWAPEIDLCRPQPRHGSQDPRRIGKKNPWCLAPQKW